MLDMKRLSLQKEIYEFQLRAFWNILNIYLIFCYHSKVCVLNNLKGQISKCPSLEEEKFTNLEGANWEDGSSNPQIHFK